MKLRPVGRLLAAGWLLVASVAAWPQGDKVYAQHCSACHQPDGSGTVGLAPALKGEHWQKLSQDRTYLPLVVLKGLAGRITVNAQTFVGSMPPWAEQISDADMAELLTHVQGLQGFANGVPYRAEEVAALRAKPGSPMSSLQLRQSLLGAK
jgi:mono/diheme cytochrome c family protein